MKGVVEDIGTTLLVMITIIFILFAAILILVIFKSPPEFLSSSTQFVAAVSRPYQIATSIAHYLADDRQVLEQAIEASVGGSIEKSNSRDLAPLLKQFLGLYKDNVKFISVSVTE